MSIFVGCSSTLILTSAALIAATEYLPDSPLSVSISDVLKQAGYDSLRAQIVFEVKSASSNFQCAVARFYPVVQLRGGISHQIRVVIDKRIGIARGFGYKKLGYDKMPKFLFGTDASGFDTFKRAFAGLRTSLFLGVCTAAFCFSFGLVWGAVSGYFGGNVDIWSTLEVIIVPIEFGRICLKISLISVEPRVLEASTYSRPALKGSE